ncbi:hypothetical protein FQR65_LT08233 [Abscondita terminalis]|nr:hypothetical protein FQR65_LT08233 [Abscondita terminalis]
MLDKLSRTVSDRTGLISGTQAGSELNLRILSAQSDTNGNRLQNLEFGCHFEI